MKSTSSVQNGINSKRFCTIKFDRWIPRKTRITQVLRRTTHRLKNNKTLTIWCEKLSRLVQPMLKFWYVDGLMGFLEIISWLARKQHWFMALSWFASLCTTIQSRFWFIPSITDPNCVFSGGKQPHVEIDRETNAGEPNFVETIARKWYRWFNYSCGESGLFANDS